MSVTYRLRAFLRRKLGHSPARQQVTIGTATYSVRAETYREIPDYDDAWLFACAHHAQFIIDVGAHTGYTSLIAFAAGNPEEIYLVEANPEALIAAADNLIWNGLIRQARLINAFASDEAEKTQVLWTIESGAAGSMFRAHAHSAANSNSSITVRTITLDALSDAYNFVPDLVKIDVEGAESRVLSGAMAMTQHRRTRFLVEMHSNAELSMYNNAATVLSWADAAGYRVWYLAEGSQLTDPQMIEKRGRCHLLLQPEDWPYPDWLAAIKQGASFSAVM